MKTTSYLVCPNCGDGNFTINSKLTPEQFECYCENCGETYILEIELEESE